MRKKNPLWDQPFHPERVAIHINSATPDRYVAGFKFQKSSRLPRVPWMFLFYAGIIAALLYAVLEAQWM